MEIRGKNNFLKKMSVFIFSAACIAGCIFIAQFFASALTTGVLPTSLNAGSNISGFEIYTVCLGNFSTRSSAESAAESYRQKDMGGYVYEADEKFCILESAYEKENDARLVQEDLERKGHQCEIMKITFKEVVFDNVSSLNQERNFLEGLNIFRRVFIDLRDISISLDANIINETRAKVEIISIKANVEGSLQKINRGATSIDGIYYQIIRNKYTELVLELDDLKDYEQGEYISLSVQIKYSYLKTLQMAKDLIDLLNGEI